MTTKRMIITLGTDGTMKKTLEGFTAGTTECLENPASILVDSIMEDKELVMRSDLDVVSESTITEHE